MMTACRTLQIWRSDSGGMPVLIDMQIFFSGSETASDMPLGLVVVEDFLYLCCKTGIELLKPFRDVLMYCGF